MPWFTSANQDFAYPQVFLWWSVFADVDQLILDYQQQELQKEATFTLWFLCVFFLSVAKKSHSYDFESSPPLSPIFCVLLLWQLLCVGIFFAECEHC